MEYEKKLNLLNVKELKAFIKSYNLQTKIVMTKKKKEDLIADILKHTDFQNGKVIIKSNTIEGNIEAKPKVIKEKIVKPKVIKEKVIKPKKEVMKVEPKKEVMKVEPKKEVMKEELTRGRGRYISENTGFNIDGSIQQWKIEEIKKTNEVLQKLGGPDFWKNPYKILDGILGKRREVRQILVDDKTKSFNLAIIEPFEDDIIEYKYGIKTPNGFGKEHELFNRVSRETQKVFVPSLHKYLIYSNGKVSGGAL